MTRYRITISSNGTSKVYQVRAAPSQATAETACIAAFRKEFSPLHIVHVAHVQIVK